MPTPARFAAALVLGTALVAAGCNKTDPKTEAALAKLEAESAAQKATIAKLEEDLKKVQPGGASQQPSGTAPQPPTAAEERSVPVEAGGKFAFNTGEEGVVTFGQPFAQPPAVKFGSDVNVTVTECTATGFKWKDISNKNLPYTSPQKTDWTAKGMRRLHPGEAEEQAKYGKQVAEQFLRAFVDLTIGDGHPFVTGRFAGEALNRGGYDAWYQRTYYGTAPDKAVDDAKRFKSFAVASATFAPNGREVLCTGTLDGDKRKAEFSVLLVPGDNGNWRVDAFHVTDESAEKK